MSEPEKPQNDVENAIQQWANGLSDEERAAAEEALTVQEDADEPA